MDNLVENLNHQASNARKLRAKHEEDAIGLIKQIGLSKSKIQVSGAALELGTRSSSTGLSWSYLEKEIAAWATKSGGVTPAQVQSLLTWLHEHRGQREEEFLKRLKPTTE